MLLLRWLYSGLEKEVGMYMYFFILVSVFRWIFSKLPIQKTIKIKKILKNVPIKLAAQLISHALWNVGQFFFWNMDEGEGSEKVRKNYNTPES